MMKKRIVVILVSVLAVFLMVFLYLNRVRIWYWYNDHLVSGMVGTIDEHYCSYFCGVVMNQNEDSFQLMLIDEPVSYILVNSKHKRTSLPDIYPDSYAGDVLTFTDTDDMDVSDGDVAVLYRSYSYHPVLLEEASDDLFTDADSKSSPIDGWECYMLKPYGSDWIRGADYWAKYGYVQRQYVNMVDD